MENKSDIYYISIDDLAIGIYIHLDLRWMEHSFSLNSFKIKNDSQIGEIKALGLKKIRINPERSTFVPSPFQELVPDNKVEPVPESVETKKLSPAEQERVAFINQQRVALDECEKQFAQAANDLRNINANVHKKPKESFESATGLVQNILKTILNNKDIAIHLMSDKVGGEEMYHHALNVSVLAMMLAKELSMSPADIEQLGIGCLFHDIGKTEIPDRVLKIENPTRAETNLMQQHSAYSGKIGVKMALSQQAMDTILQHHEHVDGTGYPNALIGTAISPLAKVAAIVNAYDNHCNRINPSQSLTPYEALAHMYANERCWFDVGYLSLFVRCMGVYPPGTLVRLSDETLGLVIASNFGMPLRPKVLIFDPTVPKDKATILDLQQLPDLSVKDSLRPVEIGLEVYEYLSPRTRMTYFFDAPQRNSTR